MQLISDIQQASEQCRQWREDNETIAFVPTMGCLHAGHLGLVEKAMQSADRVVVSIFVNPLQFDDPADLSKYPKTLEEDLKKLGDYEVDLVFIPETETFYAEGEENVEKIDPGAIATILEGEKRPGHFAGVTTVVKRLFEIIQPTVAVFGEKDFQQVMVVSSLIREFGMNISLQAIPTFREPDGLAMSSRNTRLSPAERKQASEIYRQMKATREAILSGNTDFSELESIATGNLTQLGFDPEYVAIRQADTLLKPQNPADKLVILVAAKLGETRLIDNMRV